MNPKAAEDMARYGITPKKVYGVSLPNLAQIAKEIGKITVWLSSSGNQIFVKHASLPA